MTRENTLSDGKRILKVSSIALIIGAMITPLMLGGITVYWHSEKKLKLNVEKSNAAAIRRFEWMLDYASSSAKAFSSLSDKPCSQIVEALRRQAASVPFARSVLLVRNNIMYCSTIYGQLDEPIDYSVFTEGTLLLRMDDHLIPGGVVILFRAKNHSGDMVFNIDGQVAAHFLNQGESTPATEISIGNTSLRRDGVMSVAPQNTSIVAFSTSKSNNYPFSISGGYEYGVVWRHVRENYLHFLILFAGMGLVAAYGTKKLIHRSHNIKSDILRGLQRNEFIPYYQPLVNSESRECSGVEVLVRWQHPRVGIVTPAFFVPWMEKTGLIKEMTLNLFNSVEKDLSKIATQLSKNFHISINISQKIFQIRKYLNNVRIF